MVDIQLTWIYNTYCNKRKITSKGGNRLENVQITLAAARVNAGLTQSDAAKKLGVTKQTLVGWEKGRSEPKIRQAQQMSALYKIPLDNIFLPCKSN